MVWRGMVVKLTGSCGYEYSLQCCRICKGMQFKYTKDLEFWLKSSRLGESGMHQCKLCTQGEIRQLSHTLGCPFRGSKYLAASVPATRAAATLNCLRLVANTLAQT